MIQNLQDMNAMPIALDPRVQLQQAAQGRLSQAVAAAGHGAGIAASWE